MKKDSNKLLSTGINALPFKVEIQLMKVKGHILRCAACTTSLVPIKKIVAVYGMRCPRCKRKVMFS